MTAPTPILCEGGCGRLLRTPDSIRRRYGRVCWEKANPTQGRGHSLRARRPKPTPPATDQLTLFEETTMTTTPGVNDTTDLITWMREQTGIDRSAALQQRGWDRRMAEDQATRATVPAVVVPPLSELGAPGDPDQVLRDVEAKRRIIDAYEMSCGPREGERFDRNVHNQDVWSTLGEAVKLLATAYADRDGYQADAWKPWEPEL